MCRINSIYYNNERHKEKLQIFIVTDTINIYNKLISVCNFKQTLEQMKDLSIDSGGVKIVIPPAPLMDFLGITSRKICILFKS